MRGCLSGLEGLDFCRMTYVPPYVRISTAPRILFNRNVKEQQAIEDTTEPSHEVTIILSLIKRPNKHAMTICEQESLFIKEETGNGRFRYA